jgi:hypothetical protein
MVSVCVSVVVYPLEIILYTNGGVCSSPDLTVRQVHGIARKARKEIEALAYVVEADIHLELFDKEESMIHDDKAFQRGAR